MGLFRGINAINLDTKGRMALPSRYRDRLDESNLWVVTIDTESPCLLLYPLHEWEIIEKKLESLPSFNPAARRIQRLLMGHATDVELDANGRFVLPPVLRDYAQLEKQVMLVGQGRKFEIWDAQQWSDGRTNWLAEETDLPAELQSLAL